MNKGKGNRILFISLHFLFHLYFNSLFLLFFISGTLVSYWYSSYLSIPLHSHITSSFPGAGAIVSSLLTFDYSRSYFYSYWWWRNEVRSEMVMKEWMKRAKEARIPLTHFILSSQLHLILTGNISFLFGSVIFSHLFQLHLIYIWFLFSFHLI